MTACAREPHKYRTKAGSLLPVFHRTLPLPARRLMMARGMRSLGQGALVAAFALYLRALGWSAPQIGFTLSAALLSGAVLTAVVGPLSDRHGRRAFLLIYEALQAAAALLACLTAWPPALIAAAVVAGFGRGANGSAGPFGPLEQAWLAHIVPAARRGGVFSLNAGVGFVGMALGALLAGGVRLLIGPLGPVLAYRALFLLSLLGSVGAFAVIAGLPEPAGARLTKRSVEAAQRLPAAREQVENRMLIRLIGVNILNGLGIGMVAPLIAYWFALRYRHGLGTIGPALAVSFLLGGVGSFIAGRLSRRHGLIRPVVIMRGIGLVLLAAVPLAPNFTISATLYALRRGFNGGTAGVRQALVMGLTSNRQGLAASLQWASTQIPRAIGPVLTTVLLRAGMLKAPFFLAAAFQLGYLVLYALLFRDHAAMPRISSQED
jgi:MFS family permease